MTTENIQVDVADDGGSTSRLTAAFNTLAGAADKVADSETKAGKAAGTLASANDRAAQSSQRLAQTANTSANGFNVMQRAGAGASAAANAFGASFGAATSGAAAFVSSTGSASSGMQQFASAGDRAAGIASQFGQRVQGAGAAAASAGRQGTDPMRDSVLRLNEQLGTFGPAAAAAANASADMGRKVATASDGAKNANAALERLGLSMRVVPTQAALAADAARGAGTSLDGMGNAAAGATGKAAGLGGAAAGVASGVAGLGAAAGAAAGSISAIGAAAGSAAGGVSGLAAAAGAAARPTGVLVSAMGGVRQVFGTVASAAASVAGGFGSVRERAGTLAGSLGSLTGVMGGLAAYFGTEKVIKLADAWGGYEAKLRLSTKTLFGARQALQEVYQISQQTFTPLEANVGVYQRLGDAIKRTQIPATELPKIMLTLSQSVALSGSTAESAKAGLMQFQQALASGTLRGEEFNSVMENLPGLARVLADGMRVGVNALRGMAEQGQITAQKMLEALRNEQANVAKAFAQTNTSVSNATTYLENAFTRWVGMTNQANGATNQLAKGIIFLADNLNIVIPVITVFAGLLAGLAFVKVTMAIGSMVTSLAMLTGAVIANTAAWLANPIVLGLLVASLAGLVIAFKTYGTEIRNATANVPVLGDAVAKLDDKMNGAATSHIELYNAQKKVTTQTDQANAEIGRYNTGVTNAKNSTNQFAGAAGGAAGATGKFTNALEESIQKNEEFFKTLDRTTMDAIQAYNRKGEQGKLVTTEWDDALGRFIVKVEQVDGSVKEFGRGVDSVTSSTERATSATNSFAGAMQGASDSARGYGSALYGVSDAQNNLAAITGRTTAEIDAQKRAIAEASTYVDRYNNSVSAMSENLGSGWGGTKGTISVPGYTFAGAPQTVVGAGGNNSTANASYLQNKQVEWEKFLADLDDKGALQDGRINSNSDYIKANPGILNEIKQAAMSGTGLLNRDLSNFIVAGKASANPTASTATTSNGGGSAYTPVYSNPVASTPTVMTPSTSGSTSTGSGTSLDTGATATELGGLAQAAHSAALALNSIYSALKGEGVLSFATDSGSGSTEAGMGVGGSSGSTVTQDVQAGTAAPGTGIGTLPTANDNAAPTAATTFNLQAVTDALTAIQAQNDAKPIDGRDQFTGMTYGQIADWLISSGKLSKDDVYQTTENTTNNTNTKKIGTVVVNIGVKDTSQLGRNAKQNAQDMARELAKAI